MTHYSDAVPASSVTLTGDQITVTWLNIPIGSRVKSVTLGISFANNGYTGYWKMFGIFYIGGTEASYLSRFTSAYLSAGSDNLMQLYSDPMDIIMVGNTQQLNLAIMLPITPTLISLTNYVAVVEYDA